MLNRSGLSGGRLPSSKREAEMLSQQWLKQAQETAKLVNTTKKPDVFFGRYAFLLDLFERLAYCERWVRFNGEAPSKVFARFNAAQDEETGRFIMRYAQETREKIYNLSTAKGKANRAEAFYNTLTEYSDQMSDANVVLLGEQYQLLKNIVGK